ncbi:hypothetical protein [Roseateles sp. L2-2]|uniref:hypothetical protein n=1 Tax=Roseateles sp. L2-2 TaxID=3422597 RepID=UPI003D36E4DF
MTTISSRPGNVLFESGQDAIPKGKAADAQAYRPLPPQPPIRPPESSTADLAQIAERRAALRAAVEVVENSGGLGASAEEITFGTSERAELETHDESRDARERKEDRVEALMRIDAIHSMMRQLSGEQGFASIRQRAERFASLWAQGRSQQAMEELDAGILAAAEREALLHLALRKLPPGADVGALNALLEEADRDPDGTVRQLMRTTVPTTTSTTASADFAPDSSLLAALQSPPSPKLVLEAASGLGRDGLGRLEAMAVPRGRVDARRSRGAEVFLSLTLLRMIQQVRQVEQSGVRMMKAGAAAGPCPGADNAEEIRKTARWLLETTFAPAPQAVLGRMGTVLKVSGDALASVRRQMQRELHQLPGGVWLNAETKQVVSNELKNANTADLERRGLLLRAGLGMRTDRPAAPAA